MSAPRVTAFPDEPHREFLALFDVKDRSSVANVFYEAVRNGASTVVEVQSTVAAILNQKVREYGQYDDSWARRRKIVFSNREPGARFAQYAIDRETGVVPKHVAAPEHDSHLEDFFAAAWRDFLATKNHSAFPLELVAQHRVGIYRLDFAIVGLKIAVELDGHDYHKTREQRAHDAAKGRFLTVCGWLVFRYTGDEVHADPQGCAAELYRLAVRRGAFEFPYEAIAGKERRA
jgi:very-short-patch-repair endonuclease